MRLAKAMRGTPCLGAAFTATLARPGLFLARLTLLLLAFESFAFAQADEPGTLNDYPDTALEGTLAERLTSSFEECRRNCSANASCAGFDHSPRNFDCRLFSNVGAARQHSYSAAGTRLPVDGYMAPVTQLTPTGKPSEGPAPETECDRLAAHPEDGGKIASVKGNWRRVTGGTKACEAAVARYPNEPRFQFQLGRAYWGDGDEKRAEALFRQAADAGYTAGYVGLGVMVARNREQSIDFLRAAADKGDRWGMGWLATLYFRIIEENDQDRENNAEAYRLLARCVELGSAFCQCKLADMYYHGVHVQRSRTRADNLLRQSAESGYPGAMLSLGRAHAFGRHFSDIEKDYRLAAKYLIRAHHSGYFRGNVILYEVWWKLADYPDLIRELQAVLKAEGFYHGQIDGKLGPATREAIMGAHAGEN